MVIDLVLEGKIDDLLYYIIIALPQAIFPLILSTIIFHIIIIKTVLNAPWKFTTRLIIGIVLSSLVVLIISLIDGLRKGDLIFVAVFTLSIILSYYLVERQLFKRIAQND
jgi:hypothetical protein